MLGALAEGKKHVKIVVMNYLVESELSFAMRPAGRSLLFVCWHKKGKLGPGALHCFRACRAIFLVDPWLAQGLHCVPGIQQAGRPGSLCKQRNAC